jgi:hypothetical protein
MVGGEGKSAIPLEYHQSDYIVFARSVPIPQLLKRGKPTAKIITTL